MSNIHRYVSWFSWKDGISSLLGGGHCFDGAWTCALNLQLWDFCKEMYFANYSKLWPYEPIMVWWMSDNKETNSKDGITWRRFQLFLSNLRLVESHWITSVCATDLIWDFGICTCIYCIYFSWQSLELWWYQVLRPSSEIVDLLLWDSWVKPLTHLSFSSFTTPSFKHT